MIFQPTGNRVLVKVLENEQLTTGGVLIPGIQVARAFEAKREDGGGADKKFLQLVEVLEPGDGIRNPQTGVPIGPRFKKGQRCLMRVGLSAQTHIDYLPDGTNRAIVLEDVLVGIVKVGEEARESTVKPVPVAAAS